MELFKEILVDVRRLIESSPGRDRTLGDICSLLRRKVAHYDWVGFYLVDGGHSLVLGPYAGTPTEHARIAFGQGICGQAAERAETFVVQDVSREENYLSCSVHVKSEIVVPIFKDGAVAGELDIDSHQLAPFTDKEREYLEQLCGMISNLF